DGAGAPVGHPPAVRPAHAALGHDARPVPERPPDEALVVPIGPRGVEDRDSRGEGGPDHMGHALLAAVRRREAHAAESHLHTVSLACEHGDMKRVQWAVVCSLVSAAAFADDGNFRPYLIAPRAGGWGA